MYLLFLILSLAGFAMFVFSDKFKSPEERYIKIILGGPICWAWLAFLWALKKLIIHSTGG